MTEVGNNALQLGGTPEAGDVFNLTVGGTDLAVKLITVADDPAVLAPSGIQTNETEVTFADNTLTVTATGAGGNDSFNIKVNGTDVQVTATANNTAAQNATAIKTAIDAVSDLGVSITDNGDGTLTFAPTTTYQVSTDGGVTYGSTATYAANGTVGAAGAIAAAINGRTATDFVGLTATAGTDGSVSVKQAINFSAADYSPLGVADTSLASVSADGTVLTVTTATYADTDEVNFTINGEAFTVAIDDADAYGETQDGLIAKLQAEIDANTKLGGLSLEVAASGAGAITITATAATTDLVTDVSTVPASATEASTGLNVGTASDALTSIVSIDTAINTVNTQRAELGAISNRLDSTVNNLTNIATNLESGRSRILDADFAAESTNLAKSQILQQASMAMLAQANASKQGVLQLLQG